MTDKIKDCLKRGIINLNRSELPRDFDSLWYVNFIKDFDGYIVGAYYDQTNGLYLRYSTKPYKLLRMKDFSERGYNEALANLMKNKTIEVSLLGLTRNGDLKSALTVTCKPVYEFVVNEPDCFVIKLTPESNELTEFSKPPKTIELSTEDYEFLKELQHELNTQDNDGNADPVYWGVMEKKERLSLEGDGEPKIAYEEGVWSLKEAVEYVDTCVDDDLKDKWDAVDKNFIGEVLDFMVYELKWEDCCLIWMKEEQVLSHDTGAFITKRACKEYIEKYGYNHDHPHTYAMTAYRNYELETLLKILKKLNFK